MSSIGGRGGRSDDWPNDHARARARAAEQLDAPLAPDEARWLADHLAGCAACASAAADYASQRLELRALRDRVPVPPRDLWARTSAAIERESRHRRGERRGPARRSLTPYALLAGALVVAVAVGTLTSSQWFYGNPTTPPGATDRIAVLTPSPLVANPTPLAVGPKDVAYLSRKDGKYAFTTTRIDEVCPAEASDCVPNQPKESTTVIAPIASPESVFGSEGQPIVVVANESGTAGSKLFAVVVPDSAAPSESPSESPSATPTPASTASPVVAPTSPPATPVGPTSTPSEPPATPSTEPTATPSEPAAETVEIAHGLQVVDTTAAYAPDGSAFAFTAQPADGSHGPDIYVWNVDDKEAHPITTDHRSVFGSWSGDAIVGSSLALSTDGTSADPTAFVVRDAAAPVALPDAGLAWRPAVDPSGATAVYWTGSLAPTADGTGWQTLDGKLVIGRWDDVTSTEAPGASGTPAPGDSGAGGSAAPDQPTAPDQSTAPTAALEPSEVPTATGEATARRQTTIAEGPLTDWDVRWDKTGTRLAVWIADRDDPSVGTLSLYVVDPFDGSIDLANPPLRDAPALAGFSIDDGRLAWATPEDGTEDGGRVLILAWTDDGFGQVESAPGDFLLVR
jgi:hypothetical protein